MAVKGVRLRARRRLLDAGPDVVAQARFLAAGTLDDAVVSLPVRADVLLVVSELVSNAARHTSGPISLAVAVTGQSILVEVTDSGDSHPPLTPRQPEPTSLSGRGLLIVDVIADRWGVWPEPEGKTVWAEINRVEPAGLPLPR
jgi:sodium/proline symporter